jgi:hypothetical protein
MASLLNIIRLCRKLKHEKLEVLLNDLSKFFATLSEDDVQYESDLAAGEMVGDFIDALIGDVNKDTETARKVGEWFVGYLEWVHKLVYSALLCAEHQL